MTEATQPIEERAAELERRLKEIEATTAARLIRAELKAEAVRAGIVDLDGLKLLDSSAVKLNEQGDVEGVATLIMQLRRAKPWLFGGASSSSAAAAPPAQAPEGKPATKMSYDEWQAARAELLKRR
jgi:hypothetical protein